MEGLRSSSATTSNEITDADMLRKELENFLKSSREKIGEDGEPVLCFPDSFDDISAAMDRTDLNSNSTWSTQIFNQEYKSSEKRYAQLLSTEAENERIQHGIAKIEMLDKKLKLLTKMAAIEFNPESGNNNEPIQIVNIENDNENIDHDIQVSPNSYSISSDGLFLTRLQRQQHFTEADHDSNNYDIDDEFSCPLSSRNRRRKDMIKNEALSRGQISLTLTPSERVTALLHADSEETDDIWKDICTYGYSAADQTKLNAIDEKVKAYLNFLYFE